MITITRRQFLRQLARLGLGSLGAAALASSGGCQPASAQAETLDLASPHIREATYYAVLPRGADCDLCHETPPSRITYCHITHGSGYVQCHLCPRQCILADGERGECRVRQNQGGRLYTLVYGNPCAVHVDPIEKKPFYHVLPGSASFSLATAGCNLRCLYCQNWAISQARPEDVSSRALLPAEVSAEARKEKCASVAFTYTEPTIFYEYMMDAAHEARRHGIKSVVVSAGYINPAPLRALCTVVDAIKIDLKAFSDSFYQRICGGTLEPVLEAIRTIHDAGIHLEIVNLVVPTLNDDEDDLRGLCRWLMEHVGPQVPLHFTRFTPMYKLQSLPMTPVATLEKAHAIARDAGLQYVYIGNVPGHAANNTYCPRCGRIVIERAGFVVTANRLRDGRCPDCGYPIIGIWA